MITLKECIYDFFISLCSFRDFEGKMYREKSLSTKCIDKNQENANFDDCFNGALTKYLDCTPSWLNTEGMK